MKAIKNIWLWILFLLKNKPSLIIRKQKVGDLEYTMSVNADNAIQEIANMTAKMELLNIATRETCDSLIRLCELNKARNVNPSNEGI